MAKRINVAVFALSRVFEECQLPSLSCDGGGVPNQYSLDFTNL